MAKEAFWLPFFFGLFTGAFTLMTGPFTPTDAQTAGVALGHLFLVPQWSPTFLCKADGLVEETNIQKDKHKNG